MRPRSARSPFSPLLGVLIAAAALWPGGAAAAVDSTNLVSRADGTGGSVGNGPSTTAAVSDDGRYVAFSSSATNLAPADADAGAFDVFRRDTITGDLVHVSVEVPAADSAGTPTISDDGCRVSFVTTAEILPADNVASADIYVRDLCPLAAPSTLLASRRNGAGGTSTGNALFGHISGDGNRVAFETISVVPVAGGESDANADGDIFVRELNGSNTYLASQNAAGTAAGSNGSHIGDPISISDDGRRVAFLTIAADMAPGDTNGFEDIYVRTGIGTGSEANVRATLTSSEAQLDSGVFAPGGLSGNGDYAVWTISDPQLPGGSNPSEQAYIRRLSSGTTELVSLGSSFSSADSANGPALAESVSDDGRFVTFSSHATNLTFANGVNDDVFLRDRTNGTTTLLSRRSGSTGAPGGDSRRSALSGSGNAVAWESDSSMAGGDANGQSDAYARSLGEPAAPAQGKKANLRPIQGKVLVRRPGKRKFSRLTFAKQFPIGTEVDARRGRVALTSAAKATRTQTAEFFAGLFVFTQKRKGSGLTTAALSQKLSCAAPKNGGRLARAAAAGPLAQAAGRRKKRRKLWGKGRGKFKTKGSRGSATVRGTTWLVADKCTKKGPRTLIRVTEGSVAVDDFGKKGKVNKILRARAKYTAKPAGRQS